MAQISIFLINILKFSPSLHNQIYGEEGELLTIIITHHSRQGRRYWWLGIFPKWAMIANLFSNFQGGRQLHATQRWKQHKAEAKPEGRSRQINEIF